MCRQVRRVCRCSQQRQHNRWSVLDGDDVHWISRRSDRRRSSCGHQCPAGERQSPPLLRFLLVPDFTWRLYNPFVFRLLICSASRSVLETVLIARSVHAYVQRSISKLEHVLEDFCTPASLPIDSCYTNRILKSFCRLLTCDLFTLSPLSFR
jgi:hypothetical protein